MHSAGVMLVAQLIEDDHQRIAALRQLWSPRPSHARAAAPSPADRPALDIAGLMRLRFRFGT